MLSTLRSRAIAQQGARRAWPEIGEIVAECTGARWTNGMSLAADVHTRIATLVGEVAYGGTKEAIRVLLAACLAVVMTNPCVTTTVPLLL